MRFAHKYSAKKCTYDGYSFASKLEAATYALLKLQEKAGEIKDIKCQDHVYLTNARINYIADFQYFDMQSGELTWAESKGMETSDYRIKRKLWMYYGPGKLLVYKGTWTKPFLFETIIPKI